MTILVTGAAGFIGRHLMRVWPAFEQVVGVDQCSIAPGPWPRNVDYRRLALTDVEAFEKTVLEFSPRLIVHLAALSHTAAGVALGSETIGFNAELTLTVLRAALALKRRGVELSVVVAGSAAEYGDIEPGAPPPNEAAELRPKDPYAKSKAASSLSAIGFGCLYSLPVNVVRFANVYGAGQGPEKFIPTVIDKLIKGEKITLHRQGAPTRQWVHVNDACTAIAGAASHPLPAVFNVAHPDEISNARIAFVIAKLLEEALRWRDLLSLLNPVDEGGGSARVAMDVGRIERVLGWKSRIDISSGLEATIAAALKERGLV